MSLPFTDNFNRINSVDLGPDWDTRNVAGDLRFGIVSTGAQPSSFSDDCRETQTGNVYSNDQYAQAEFTVNGTAGGGAGIGLILRSLPGAKTFYRFVIDHAASNNYEIGRFSAGSFTSIKVGTSSFTNGDTFKFSAVGSGLNIYRNGSLITGVFDNTLSSGYPGIAYSSTETSASLDNFEAGNVVAASGSGTGIQISFNFPVTYVALFKNNNTFDDAFNIFLAPSTIININNSLTTSKNQQYSLGLLSGLINNNQFDITSLLQKTVDNSFDVEYGALSTSIISNFVNNIEYLIDVFSSFDADISFNLGLLFLGRLDIESTTRLSNNITLNEEYLQKTSSSAINTLNTLSDSLKNNTLDINYLSSLAKSSIFNLEELLRITNISSTFNIEYLLDVLTGFDIDIGFGQSVRVNGPMSICYLLKTIQNNVADVAYQSSLSKSNIQSICNLLTVYFFNTYNISYGGTAGTGLTANFNFDLEILSGILKGNSTDIESKSSIIRLLNVNLELLRLIKNDSILSQYNNLDRITPLIENIAYLSGLLSINVTDITAGGTAGIDIAKSFPIDIDWLTGFISNGTIDLEFTARLIQSLNSDLEYVRRINFNNTTDVEYLRKIVSQHGPSIEYGGTQNVSILKDNILPIDYLSKIPGIQIIDLESIGQFSTQNTMSLEELRKLSMSAIYGVLHNAGILRNHKLNVEFDGVVALVHANEVWILSNDDDNIWYLTK